MDKTGSEGGEDHIITFPQLTLIVPQCKRYRSRTRIAVMLNVHHHLVHRQFQTFGHGLNDTHVSLMGYNPLDIILVQAITFSDQRTVIAHVRHSITEHRAPLLIEVVQTMVDGEMRRWADRSTCFQMQERKSLAVCTQIGVHHTDILFLRTFQEHRSSTVAEERTGRAVLIISD